MKIRIGFVSNSSSSSFVVWGVTLDVDDIIEIAKKMNIEFDKDDIDQYELSEKIFGESGEEFDHAWFDDQFFVGFHPASMNEDETLRDFKTRVSKALTEKNINQDLEFIETVITD